MADDERNPAQSRIVENAVQRLKNGRFHLIPESAETCGHGTTGNARFYADELRSFLETVPTRAGQAASVV